MSHIVLVQLHIAAVGPEFKRRGKLSMFPILPLERHPGWQDAGRRYLDLKSFQGLCQAVGLHSCDDRELEAYERKGWLFPAARLVMPEDYAMAFWEHILSGSTSFEFDETHGPFHQLNWALRGFSSFPTDSGQEDLQHPIDQSWDKVKDGLVRPRDMPFVAWEEFTVPVPGTQEGVRNRIADHYYHAWQVHELYQVRKYRSGMYRDNTPLPTLEQLWVAQPEGLSALFEAVSWFQHLYRARWSKAIGSVSPDADGWAQMDDVQYDQLEKNVQADAQSTLRLYGLDEDSLYAGLQGMIRLHESYDQADRYRLAKVLSAELWRTLELIHFAFGTSPAEIAEKAGQPRLAEQPYLKLLFPDRRSVVRDKAAGILQSLAQDHNKQAPQYAMGDAEIEALLNYVECTDLALFEYILVELNDAFYDRHSWHAAATFLQLKSLASFPESLMRTVILNSGDQATIASLHKNSNRGMSYLNELVVKSTKPTIWSEYYAAGSRSAQDKPSFVANLSRFDGLISSATTREAYLGVSLSLATLLRNFTSHLLVEDPELLRGQYTRCARAATSSAFLIWHVVQSRGWV
jgi:hypothetical protein